MFGTQFGLIEAVLFYAVFWILITYPIPNFIILNQFNSGFFQFLKSIYVPIVASLLMLISNVIFINVFNFNQSIFSLITLFTLSMAIYYFIVSLFKISIFKVFQEVFEA